MRWFRKKKQVATPGPQTTSYMGEITPEIRGFLVNLLIDAGVIKTGDEVPEDKLRELFDRLDYLISAKLVDTLSDKQLDQFIRMNEQKKSPAELQTFLIRHIPNAREVFTETFLEFRQMYLDQVEKESLDSPANDANTGSQEAL